VSVTALMRSPNDSLLASSLENCAPAASVCEADARQSAWASTCPARCAGSPATGSAGCGLEPRRAGFRANRAARAPGDRKRRGGSLEVLVHRREEEVGVLRGALRPPVPQRDLGRPDVCAHLRRRAQVVVARSVSSVVRVGSRRCRRTTREVELERSGREAAAEARLGGVVVAVADLGRPAVARPAARDHVITPPIASVP